MKLLGDRKATVKRLVELMETKARYLSVPTFAYEVGGFTIGRDGTVTVEEGADATPLLKLAEEGLLEGFENDSADDGGDAVETDEPLTETPPEASATPLFEQGGELVGEDPHVATEAAGEGAEANPLFISVPMANHTTTSIRNLVSMIYSRGSLLSKATGGNFHATMEQVEAMRDCISVDDIRSRISENGLKGIRLEPDRITFIGFPASEDPDKALAFTQLADRMCRTAMKQKRTAAKTVDESNERYIFRIWLIAIGMKGDEYKTVRMILLAPLTGSKAFRTREAEERFKAAQKEKAASAERPKALSETTKQTF